MLVILPHGPTSSLTNIKTTTTKTRYITHTIGGSTASSVSSSASSSILFSTTTTTEAETETEIGTEQDSDIDIIDRSKSLPTTETKITIEKEIVIADDDDVDGIGVSSPPNSQESSSESSTTTTPSLYDSLSEIVLGPNKYRQLLEFVEPTTNVTVLLIGSMHYNPASIELVEQTVEKLGRDDKLGSVIIESCDIRWNKTQTIMDKKNTKLQEKQQAKAEAEEESQASSSSVTSSDAVNITLNKDDLLGK